MNTFLVQISTEICWNSNLEELPKDFIIFLLAFLMNQEEFQVHLKKLMLLVLHPAVPLQDQTEILLKVEKFTPNWSRIFQQDIVASDQVNLHRIFVLKLARKSEEMAAFFGINHSSKSV